MRKSRRSERPKWDNEKRELWFRGRLVKRIRRRADNMVALLQAFQTKHWPGRSSDPLPDVPGINSKERLHNLIKKLNRGQRLIHFGGDGTGTAVLWYAFQEFWEASGSALDGP